MRADELRAVVDERPDQRPAAQLAALAAGLDGGTHAAPAFALSGAVVGLAPRLNPSESAHLQEVSDGIRTRDRRDHNPELYQLSYAHQGRRPS